MKKCYFVFVNCSFNYDIVDRVSFLWVWDGIYWVEHLPEANIAGSNHFRVLNPWVGFLPATDVYQM